MKHFFILIFACLALTSGRAGVYFEHKFIGDWAFKKFVREKGLEDFFRNELGMHQFGIDACIPYISNEQIIDYYPDLFYFEQYSHKYSYGDLTALSGDHSLSIVQLVKGLFDSLFTDQPAPLAYADLAKELTHAWTVQRLALDQGEKEASYFFLSYVLLANGDKSHFQRPPLDVHAMLQCLPIDFIDSFTYMRNHPSLRGDERMQNLRYWVEKKFLKFNNTLKYSMLHLVALDYMRSAAIEHFHNQQEKFKINFVLALISNAFADHFLQDAFAAGHIPVRRSLFGLDNKGVHDYYCRNGLWVSSDSAGSWYTYGDNFYDTVTFEKAINANVVSLNELWLYFQREFESKKSHTSDESLYDQLASGKIPVASYADSVLAHTDVFHHLPTPLDKKGYRRIELKRGSKVGGYLDAMVFHYGNHQSGWGLGLSPFGLDFTNYKGEKNRKMKEALFKSKKETKIWMGLSGNYSRWQRDKAEVHSLMGGIDFTYKDQWVIECKWGGIHEGRSYFVWRPALGYEYKSLRCAVAPSVKLFYDVSAYSYKRIGIAASLRLY